MQIALYEPDIPQNAGNIIRTATCLAVPVHLIEPAGFDASDRALRRAGLDYLNHAQITRHESFVAFEAWRKHQGERLILLSTHATQCYTDFIFSAGDIVMLGRESAGAPEHVHASADARLVIPLAGNLRSINVAAAAAMVLGEALRQTEQFPGKD
jgi:tRNA (cytidine/uridine-2'-O-)-methyltransferase